MSMVKKLWSLSALAVELDRDRRTVAKVLGSVPPDGKTNGHRAWFLQTALSALDQAIRPGPPAPLPLGFEVLDQVKDPFNQGMLTTFLGLVYSVGPTVADLAIAAGAPVRVAFALQNMMTLHYAGEAEALCTFIGVNPSNGDTPGIFTLGALQPTDWRALAETADEPMDLQAWQKWFRERSEESSARQSNGGSPT